MRLRPRSERGLVDCDPGYGSGLTLAEGALIEHAFNLGWQVRTENPGDIPEEAWLALKCEALDEVVRGLQTMIAM